MHAAVRKATAGRHPPADPPTHPPTCNSSSSAAPSRLHVAAQPHAHTPVPGHAARDPGGGGGDCVATPRRWVRARVCALVGVWRQMNLQAPRPLQLALPPCPRTGRACLHCRHGYRRLAPTTHVWQAQVHSRGRCRPLHPHSHLLAVAAFTPRCRSAPCIPHPHPC